MKKALAIFSIILISITGFSLLSACGKEQKILVVSREKGSGTREIFDSLVTNAAGDTLTDTELAKEADQQSSNERVLTLVATTDSAIGYVSLAALNTDIKTVPVNGVAASQETVENGSYLFSRALYAVTKKDMGLTPAAYDFMRYLKSADAQDIIGEKLVRRQASAEYTPPGEAVEGRVVIRGSTTIDPLMDDLIEDYKQLTADKTRGVSFNKDTQGSEGALIAVEHDDQGETIGVYAGRIAEGDNTKYDFFELALDGIAVIVNKSNPIENVTPVQLYKIFSGEVTKFTELT